MPVQVGIVLPSEQGGLAVEVAMKRGRGAGIKEDGGPVETRWNAAGSRADSREHGGARTREEGRLLENMVRSRRQFGLG